MPLFVFILWLIVLNGATVGLAIVMFYALSRSQERRNFICFLIPYFIWANSVILVQIVGPQIVGPGPIQARYISQTIFASGALLAVSLGHFLLTFSGSLVRKAPFYKILQLNAIVLSPLSYTGLVEAGLDKASHHGLAPLPGPLLTYYNVSLMLLTGTFFYSTFRSYRSSTDRLLRYQLGVISSSACVSLSAAMITNVVLPGISGNYGLSPMGGLWVLILFCGIAHIIVTGRHVLLFDSFKRLLKPCSNDSAWTMNRMEELIFAVSENRVYGELPLMNVPRLGGSRTYSDRIQDSNRGREMYV